MNNLSNALYNAGIAVTSGSLTILYSVGIALTLFLSGIAYFFWRRRPREISPILLWVFIVASGYLFFAQYFKYRSLHFYVDFSHWLQLLYTISQTGLPYVLNQEFIVPGTLNYFTAHFVPFIYILALPFKLVPLPGTLIVLNVAFMLSSAIPLYKLARHIWNNKQFALLITVLFLWYPTFQYITLYEFEMLRFSIPILLWMLYFFETRRTLLYFLFVLVAILVREEMGLTVAMFGIYALLFAKRRKEGLFSIVFGLGGFMLITGVIMPALRGGDYSHIAAGEFSQFGNGMFGIIRGVLSQPVLTLHKVFNPLKIVNLFMLVFPLLFIPLSVPSALLGIVANVAVGLLSKSVIHTSYQLYYIAPSVPFIFYAFLKAWSKVIARFNALVAMRVVLTGVLISNIFFGPSPISLQFWFKNIRPAPFRTQDFHWSIYRLTDHHQKVEEFLPMIPEDAITSVPQFLHPRFYKKKGTLMFPKLQSKDEKWQAEYVLLDVTNNGLKPESPAYATKEEMAAVRESNEWDLIRSDDGYELYRRHQVNTL